MAYALTHITRFGAFGRPLQRFVDRYGYVAYDDAQTWGDLTDDGVRAVMERDGLDPLVRASAAVELAHRGIRDWQRGGES